MYLHKDGTAERVGVGENDIQIAYERTIICCAQVPMVNGYLCAEPLLARG